MNLGDIYTTEVMNKPITESNHSVEPKTVKQEKQSMKRKPQKTESFDSIYKSLISEADTYDFDQDDSGFDDGADVGADEFDDVSADDSFGGDDTVTVSRSALEDLKAQIDALLGDDFDDGADYADDFSYDDESYDDDIPKESRWDGTLSPQKKSNLVKDNGDVNFDQELDFDPTEDNDGPVHTGPKGEFDGKLKSQKSTDHVKGNGDANFGKVKTNFRRTDKPGNRLFGKGK